MYLYCESPQQSGYFRDSVRCPDGFEFLTPEQLAQSLQPYLEFSPFLELTQDEAIQLTAVIILLMSLATVFRIAIKTFNQSI